MPTGSIDVAVSCRRRLGNAVRSLLAEPDAGGTIWAVSVVKNELDIIEETVRSLVAQGVDRIVVGDNMSSDGTYERLLELAGELPLHVLRDPIVEHWQAEKVSHLARLAARSGAAWIVPFDADELWKGTEGRTLAEVLRSTDASVMEAEWWTFLPIPEGTSPRVAERYPQRLAEPDPQHKVAFRANWLARVTHGNHDVTLPIRRVGSGVRIAHYRWRTPEQILRKARDGARATLAAGMDLAKVPQWGELVDADLAEVEGFVERLVVGRDVERDPASQW